MFELLVDERGEKEAVLFARSATATCQKFPVHWGGDCYGTYESMAESLRGGLSLALCGFGYWSHDIGGFENKAPAAVYKRWGAFGLLSSHSRLHGSTSYRVPWTYDEEAVDVLRHFTQLKCRLMPYLMRAAVEAHESSLPMMRPMVPEFPEDPTCRTLDRQYLLGDALLVAPVFHDSQAEYYLPPGRWTHLLTGEVREGSRWYFDRLDSFGLPLWIRPNSLVAFGPEATQVEYDYRKDVRLVCGTLDGNSPSSVELVDARAERTSRFTLEQRGHEVSIVSEDGRAGFQLALPWAKEVRDLEGGRIHEAPSEVGPAPAGLVISATSSRVSFTWL